MMRTKPWRSKAYLRWVRTLPCAGCGMGQSEAHHPIACGLGGTMGGKASDVLAIPLCRVCHRELHAGVAEWELGHGGQLLHAARTVDRATREGVIE